METDQFEQAFGDFLDRREYDQAENALFSMVRVSFTAGWLAAGGKAPPPQKVFELKHRIKHELGVTIETDITPPEEQEARQCAK